MPKPQRKKRTVDEIQKLIERYRRGASLTAIGDEEGISRERVRQIFAAAGCPRRPYTFTSQMRRARRARRRELPRAELRRLYITEQRTIRQIADFYRCSLETVRANMRRAAIAARRTSELQRLRPRLYPDLTEANLRRWFVEEGQSAKQIAARLGCHSVTVHKNLVKFDIRKHSAAAPENLPQ